MREKLVLIGASTGGPGQLKKLFCDLKSDLKVPIIVAQHMGKVFIPSFVEHFKNSINAPIFGVDKAMTLNSGGIYICHQNIKITSTNPINISLSYDETIYNPNINILFNMQEALAKDLDILAILLTGIGDDGALGLANLAKFGASVVGESEESAIVYGMPKKAKELISSLDMLSIDEIKMKLQKFVDVF